MRKICLLSVFFLVFFNIPLLFAQTHISVPVDNDVYYLLNLAETRGLCSPLPAVRPYTRARVVEAINEILAAEPEKSGKLSDTERTILESARAEFNVGKKGLDLWKGIYRIEAEGRKGGTFTGEIGVTFDTLNSAAYYADEKKGYFATDTWATIFFRGDVGKNLSYGFDLSAGIMKASRSYLGEYDTFATELQEARAWPDGDYNQLVEAYSQPKAFFPYTYQKRWDGFIFGPGSITASSMESWPQNVSVGPSMLGEISGTLFDDMLLLRFSRMQHEWGGMMPGSSLVFNAAARPFMSVEAVFNPVYWFSLSSLTGVLEYYNSNGIVGSAMTFQNAFSIGQAEFNYKNIFHIDFGSTAVWPKRFELGYFSPLQDNYLYQNFIGDFDNMAIFGNIKLRYPGLGGFWASLFIDEVEFSSVVKNFNKQDRQMFAYQAGIQGIIYGIPFASVSVCYTKIEPYTYTHPRLFTPWYSGDIPMETPYVNNGVSLGYYLPPNSDEIKVRVDAQLKYKSSLYFQYQLIRHGADFGPHQVGGSALISELDPVGRGSKDSLKKNFLEDGAYQWMHIIKFGAEHKFGDYPFTIYGEAGLVYSYFTDISDAAYAKYTPPALDGRKPREQMIGDYSSSTSYILTIGFRIYK